MIDKFNGVIYLIIFIIHFLAYAVYAYRCIFGTKAFLDGSNPVTKPIWDEVMESYEIFELKKV